MLRLDPADYRPAPPPRRDYRIGIVGCGGIVRNAHLPAYRDFGYRVTACCDLDPAAREEVRRTFGIPWATADARELAHHPEVDLIDLAVHAADRAAVMEAVTEAGKPVLSQKPFALNWEDACGMVRLCRERGVPLMVNQQARWAPAHRALRQVAASGLLGHIFHILHLSRGFQDDPGSWFVRLPDFNVVDHGIHYLDLIRFLSGREPVQVRAQGVMVPGQHAVTTMCHTVLLDFPAEAALSAVSHFNNRVAAGSLHQYAWFVDGAEGSAMTDGAELTVCLGSDPRNRQVHRIEGSWFPEAFGGSMGELMAAVSEGREPECSGRDNLRSIRIALAAVESIRTGEAVVLEERFPLPDQDCGAAGG